MIAKASTTHWNQWSVYNNQGLILASFFGSNAKALALDWIAAETGRKKWVGVKDSIPIECGYNPDAKIYWAVITGEHYESEDYLEIKSVIDSAVERLMHYAQSTDTDSGGASTTTVNS